MKRFLTILLLIMLSAAAAKAQDIVVLRNGSQITAKVLEVNDLNVKYIRSDNPEGPTYILRVSEISRIVYKNGQVDEFVHQQAFVREEPVDYKVRYSDIRHNYNPRFYTPMRDDPYEPWACGVGSFFLPGLGQIIAGETGRGLMFLGVNAAFSVTEMLEIFNLGGNRYYDPYSSEAQSSKSIYAEALLFTCLTHAAFNIWGIFDAVRIAKVKNMYFQDADGLLGGVQVKFQPELAMMPSVGGSLTPTAGFSLNLTF